MTARQEVSDARARIKTPACEDSDTEQATETQEQQAGGRQPDRPAKEAIANATYSTESHKSTYDEGEQHDEPRFRDLDRHHSRGEVYHQLDATEGQQHE